MARADVMSSLGKYGETEFQVNKIAEDELKIVATSFLESGRSPRKNETMLTG